jgi:hypothetical protein
MTLIDVKDTSLKQGGGCTGPSTVLQSWPFLSFFRETEPLALKRALLPG